jgi:hypothetical protein
VRESEEEEDKEEDMVGCCVAYLWCEWISEEHMGAWLADGSKQFYWVRFLYFTCNTVLQ